MSHKKKIFAIVGSAGANSANEKLLEHLAMLTADVFEWQIFNGLKSLPHFDPELSVENPPVTVSAFRQFVQEADAVIICTPEYVFSIPSGLKNAIEWCVATTIFSDKPVGIITASASGVKGHEELQLIMKTLTAHFNDDTTLLIQGVKGKVNADGELTDEKTKEDLQRFINGVKDMENVIG